MVLNLFVLALFAFAPVRMLLGYWKKGADSKPKWYEIAGIVFCTAGMLAYMFLLMATKHFY